MKELKKAYKSCLSFKYGHRKTINKKDLDTCLYAIEELMEIIRKLETIT